MKAERSAATVEPLCPGCGRPVSECQADDVDESPAAQPHKQLGEESTVGSMSPGSSAAQTSGRDLLSTTDAQVWARAFVERFAGRMVSAGDVDEGLMLSWFANAIETGREAGRKLISIPTEEDDDDLNLRY